MTILVGILCQDGVVVGSDSSVTFGPHISAKTIEHWAVPKTFIVPPDMILAGTGQVGLCQRFHEVMWRYREANKKTVLCQNQHDVARSLCENAVKNFASTNAPKGEFGALVGMACGNSFHLCEFAAVDFQPEFKTVDGCWFTTMGSGQQIADPFLGFIGRALFKKQRPNLGDGVFAALWTLQHAIEFNTGGINGPSQIATLSKDAKGIYTARKWSDADLAEHMDNIEAVESHLGSYRDILAGTGRAATPPPAPPDPSAK